MKTDIRSPIVHRFVKFIAIGGSLSLLFSIIVLLNISKANSYEFSIYNAVSTQFWIGIFLSFMFNLFTLIFTIKFRLTGNLWKIGLFSILLCNVLLLSLPLIRGYLINGSGDVLSHMGWVKDLLLTGHLSASNVYPLLHILSTSIILISNLDIFAITFFIPICFSLFLIISFLMLSKIVLKIKYLYIASMIIFSLLIFKNSNILFHPFGQSLIFIPLITSLIFKLSSLLNREQNIIVLIILLIAVSLYHPLIGFIIIFILFIFVVSKSNKLINPIIFNFSGKTILLTPLFIATIVFLSWQANIFLLTGNLSALYDSLFSDLSSSELSRYSSLAYSADVKICDAIKLICYTYGQFIIIYLLSLPFLLKWILNLFRKTISYTSEQNAVTLITIVLLFISLFILSTISMFGFARILYISVIFSIPLTSYLIYNNFIKTNESDRKKIKSIIQLTIFLSIVLLLLFSTLNLYMSPLIKQTNQQVQLDEYIGMNMFFTTRNDDIIITEYGISSYRYNNAIRGVDNLGANIRFDNTAPPDHFYYDNGTTLKDYFDGSIYLLITDTGRDFYENIYPEYSDHWRFNDVDFQKLNCDQNVNCINNNMNLMIYLI